MTHRAWGPSSAAPRLWSSNPRQNADNSKKSAGFCSKVLLIAPGTGASARWLRRTAPGRADDRVNSMFRWLTAGESHGRALVAICDGVPAGVRITSGDVAA